MSRAKSDILFGGLAMNLSLQNRICLKGRLQIMLPMMFVNLKWRILSTHCGVVKWLRKSSGKMLFVDHTSLIVLQALRTYFWVFCRLEIRWLQIVLLWFASVWFKQNFVRLKQTFLPYDQIFSDATARLHEFHLAVDPTAKTTLVPCPTAQMNFVSRFNCWSLPQSYFFKANFDGCFVSWY